MEKREEERLESERVVDGEGIDRADDFFQNGQTTGDAQKDDDPRKSEGDESRSAREIPDPGSIS